MTASRSDCSRDPADEIPAVADDDDDMGEEASSPKFTEVLFERPNMLFCTVFGFWFRRRRHTVVWDKQESVLLPAANGGRRSSSAFIRSSALEEIEGQG